MSMTVEEALAECERWAARNRKLDERARVAIAVLSGSSDAATRSQDPQGPPRAQSEDEEAVGALATTMLAALERNRHKGHWRDLSLAHLVGRCRGELEDELSPLIAFHQDVSPENLERIMAEAADVANFAMMIHDNARRLRGAT